MTENPLQSAQVCYKVTELYRDVLNSYVSDFYIEQHWTRKLPPSWRSFLEGISLTEVEHLLNYHLPYSGWLPAPLSLLCIGKILRTNAVPQTPSKISPAEPPITGERFEKYLWQKVKLKKRHEIDIMAKMCYKMGLETDCLNIVDVGAGLGHLSRTLAYQYGFRICTFDANPTLGATAQELDGKFEQLLAKKKIPHSNKQKTVHINMRLETSVNSEDFESLVRDAFKNPSGKFKFGIVGLHPCGDLGPTLLRFFAQSPAVAFINIVSCCYMKLSLEPSLQCGYPLSKQLRGCNLDYLSCEAACHAIESYRDNLSTGGFTHLKIHSYRAALECLLVKSDKNLRHCQVNSVKYWEGLRFKEYCMQATQNYNNLSFCDEDLSALESLVERTWTDVVKFYSMRLFLSPLVESVILYDRLLYVKEHGAECDLVPAFDSRVSARNHILCARKM